MYPLRFEPIFRRYLWGGFRLRDVLGKATGDDSAAESWELVDHGDDQSVVRFGELAGKSLRHLIASEPNAILGEKLASELASDSIPQQLRMRFPLLLKFLDANRDLSIQVHPDDAFGSTLDPPDLGKTEAWYVLHAEPGAKIYSGLKEGVTESDFRAAVTEGRTPSVMHSFEAKAGDCVSIPAGTMHAIGAGLLIAEIQQASNTTFRIDDWSRVDANGNARELHIEQGIAATDFSRGPVNPERPSGDSNAASAATLVTCDKFEIRKHCIEGPVSLGGDDRFRIITPTSGAVAIESDPADASLGTAETVLFPACLESIEVSPATEGKVEFLEMFVP
jgi:mannose-6-phosphate isomerase